MLEPFFFLMKIFLFVYKITYLGCMAKISWQNKRLLVTNSKAIIVAKFITFRLAEFPHYMAKNSRQNKRLLVTNSKAIKVAKFITFRLAEFAHISNLDVAKVWIT